MLSKTRRHHYAEGFSLLELSVVLLIMAIVLGAGLNLADKKGAQQEIQNTREELETIRDTLHYYVKDHGHLPCPARINRLYGDAEYGREATDCADTSPPSGITRVEYPAGSGKFVRIGSVPFYSMGLSDEYLADDWSQRYLYAVSESLIDSISSSDLGNIEVVDDGANKISDAVAFVVLSHGKTGKGAYFYASNAPGIVCNTAEKDGENCDADGVFVDGEFNDGEVEANLNDDIILWGDVISLYKVEVSGENPSVACAGGDVSSSYGGKCYAYFNTAADWNTAKAACQAWGGELASMKTSDVNDYITDMITGAGYTARVSFGLNEVASEGNFVWQADGTALGAWTNWVGGAIIGDPDCGYFLADISVAVKGKWATTECVAVPINGYACEK